MEHDWTSADGQHRVLVGDCRARMRELPDQSVDAVVCDPPYGLEFMGKEWDSLAKPKAGNIGGFADGNKPSFSRAKKVWLTGAGTTEPGIGDRKTEWPSFGKGGGANPTCATCGRRKRGQTKCQCDEPAWIVDGEPWNEIETAVSVSRGMQEWHHSWVVEAFRVLKPGGHLLAFGGARTFHRLACAIEDAGFEIRDTILEMLAADQQFLDLWDTLADGQRAALAKSLESVGLTGLVAWNYGSGFPKSLDASKAIDKAAGAKRDVIGENPCTKGRSFGQGHHAGWERPWMSDPTADAKKLTAPATDAAKQWDGWGSALKPAFEPVVVARKPLVGTIAQNLLTHGTGALNIGACRIRAGDGVPKFTHRSEDSKNCYGDGKNGSNRTGEIDNATGRWPANVLLQHHPECRCVGTKQVKGIGGGKSSGDNAFGQDSGWNDHNNRPTEIARQLDAEGMETVEAWECHPECPCRMFPQTASGKTPKNGFYRNEPRDDVGIYGNGKGLWTEAQPAGSLYGDAGSAARFFYQSKASRRSRWFFCRDCQAAFCETERAAHQHPENRPMQLRNDLTPEERANVVADLVRRGFDLQQIEDHA